MRKAHGISAGGFIGSIVMATIGAVPLLYVVKPMRQVQRRASVCVAAPAAG